MPNPATYATLLALLGEDGSNPKPGQGWQMPPPGPRPLDQFRGPGIAPADQVQGWQLPPATTPLMPAETEVRGDAFNIFRDGGTPLSPSQQLRELPPNPVDSTHNGVDLMTLLFGARGLGKWARSAKSLGGVAGRAATAGTLGALGLGALKENPQSSLASSKPSIRTTRSGGARAEEAMAEQERGGLGKLAEAAKRSPELQQALAALRGETKPEAPTSQGQGVDLQAKQRRLQGLKNIAEGLGSFRASTPADYLLTGGPPPQDPLFAEDIRTDLAQTEGQIEGGRLRQALGRLGLQLPEGLTDEQIMRSLPGISGLQLARERQALAGVEAEQDLVAEDQKTLKKERDELLKDSQIADAMEQRDAAGQIIELVNTGDNAIAARTAARAAAKSTEPGGRLSDADVRSFLTLMGYEGTIEGVKRFVNSEPSEEWRRQMRELAEIMQRSADAKLRARIDLRASSFEESTGLPAQRIYDIMGVDPSAPATAPAPASDSNGPIYRIPASDTAAIEAAKADGVRYEVIDG